MNKWKSFIGIVLIVLSLIGLVFWEQQGRQIFLMKPVLVASRELPAGTKITKESVAVAMVPKENLVEGVLTKQEKGPLLGTYTKERILKNQQVAHAHFMKETQLLKGKSSIFVIPKEWIAMRSSSLRKGDEIMIYGNLSCQSVGVYQAAFIKDQTEQEVSAPEGRGQFNVLERTNSTGEISHVELVTTLEEYEKIRKVALDEGGLLLVQKSPTEVALE